LNTAKKQELDIESYWKTFASEEGLSSAQLEQFKKYHALLTEWNEKINLTAITDAQEIITYHFRDSLAVDRFIDFKQLHMISDVGTGGGFPGIPLKIKYPHLKLVLIEVIQKKINFLQNVVDQLGLEDVEMCDMDWRNFLRHTDYPIDLFVSRASLRPEDLMHMFKGASPYQDKNIIYWASQTWQPSKKEELYIQEIHSYVVGKNRKLVVLAKPRESSKTEQ
jgi:16S rRNA (guanine(527)-N(7))-methyltransferase RsmG